MLAGDCLRGPCTHTLLRMGKKRSEKKSETVTLDPSKYIYKKKSKLSDFKPSDTGPFKDKESARSMLEHDGEKLAKAQDVLYAQDQYSLLVLFQAMDAAGKDGTIKHVMSGINPQGCQVFSFKAPSSEELDHDFLWRAQRALPERGRIGIFNRSYYEETLVVRVHPHILRAQKLPNDVRASKAIWKDRFRQINDFERYLTENGTVVVKFFLHVSKDEQKKRFLERIEDPSKNWKFSATDVKERGHWDEYIKAYEDMFDHTSTDIAPWTIVPADNKWFTRTLVARTIYDRVKSLNLAYPTLDPEHRKSLQAAKASLLSEK